MIILTLFIVLLLFYLCCECKKPVGFPPGPKWLPIIGNLWLIKNKLSNIGYHHLVWEDMVNVYGPIVGLRLGKRNVILISEKTMMKEVCFRDGFEGRPDGFYWRQRAHGGRYGLVFAEGRQWEDQRKFSLVHLKKLGYGNDLMEDSILEEIKKFIVVLKTSQKSPVNVSRLFTIPILNILWKFITGKTYDYDDVRLKNVCNAIHKSFRLVDSSGGILQHLPILRYIAPKATGYVDFKNNHQQMWNFISDTIEEHKKIEMDISANYIDTYLQKIKMENEKNKSFSEEQLNIICLDFLQAGSDTTSNTLEFLILFLSQNPQVQKKLQSEIDNIIGRDGKPSYQDKLRMPYTSAVLLEVHRLANVAPAGIPHRALKTMKLGEYVIPKDSIILLLYYNLHMNKHWKNPYTFEPERFLDDEHNIINEELIAPFGFGKRKCIGENLAKTTLFIFCVSLFQQFDVSLVEPGKEIHISNGISLSPKPFEVYFKLRT